MLLAIGLTLLGVAIVMFYIALPRDGEIVGFLRNRSGLAEFYITLFVSLLCLGGSLAVSALY